MGSSSDRSSYVSSTSGNAWDDVSNALQNLLVVKHGEVVLVHLSDFVCLNDHEFLLVDYILFNFFEK